MIKYFLFISLFFISCKSQKVFTPKEELIIDTFEFSSGQIIEEEEKEVMLKAIMPPDEVQSSPRSNRPSVPNRVSNKLETKEGVKKKVFINIDSNINGILSYSIPDKMIVGTEYVIRLRITKDKNVDIVSGDRGISINDEAIQSNIFIESVKVEPVMSADLISDKDVFDITRTSSDIQNINDGYTEWSWIIIPLKSGENYLKLLIKVKSEGINKDITVFDKKIKIKSDVVFSLKKFLNQYWQWLMSTIIIPIIIWGWKTKKN